MNTKKIYIVSSCSYGDDGLNQNAPVLFQTKKSADKYIKGLISLEKKRRQELYPNDDINVDSFGNGCKIWPSRVNDDFVIAISTNDIPFTDATKALADIASDANYAQLAVDEFEGENDINDLNARQQAVYERLVKAKVDSCDALMNIVRVIRRDENNLNYPLASFNNFWYHICVHDDK